MLLNKYQQQMKENGYFRYPEALNAEESKIMASEALPILDNVGQYAIPTIDFLKSEKLAELFFSTKIKNMLYEIFDQGEDIFILPNLTIRNSLYINWHTDDFFLKSALEDKDDLPQFYMFNVYLQPNEPGLGGGLDIMKGTQKLPAEEKKAIIDQDIDNNDHIVISDAGDLICFDYRIVHRGTPARNIRRATRFALQWTVSNSREHLDAFNEYLLSRRTKKLHLSDLVEDRATSFFDKLDQVVYPDSFTEKQREFFDDRIVFISAE